MTDKDDKITALIEKAVDRIITERLAALERRIDNYFFTTYPQMLRVVAVSPRLQDQPTDVEQDVEQQILDELEPIKQEEDK